MKTLVSLLQQKAAIEAQIRAQRVRTIRVLKIQWVDSAEHRSKPTIFFKVGQMEDMVDAVYYDHAKFDDLLEEIEILMGVEEQT